MFRLQSASEQPTILVSDQGLVHLTQHQAFQADIRPDSCRESRLTISQALTVFMQEVVACPLATRKTEPPELRRVEMEARRSMAVGVKDCNPSLYLT